MAGAGPRRGGEPHEQTFTRNGREIWVTIRGEDRIAVIDMDAALKAIGGGQFMALRS